MASKQSAAAKPSCDDQDVVVVVPNDPAVLVVDTSSSSESDSDDSDVEEVVQTAIAVDDELLSKASAAPIQEAAETIVVDDAIDIDDVSVVEVPAVADGALSSHINVVPAPDVSEVVGDSVQSAVVQVQEQSSSTSKGNSSGLGLLAAYGSASDDDSDDDIADVVEVSSTKPQAVKSGAAEEDTYELAAQKLKNFIEAGAYRIVSDDDSSDDSDDEAGGVVGRRVVLSGSDDDSDVEIVSKSKEFVKAKGEIGIDDLPPIEDLHIQVPEAECVQMGKIFSIVEQLVLVDSLPGAVPLDLDTVLFLDKGNAALGRVFDVLGNISEPLYCVRFNSNEEIVAKGLPVGTPVFVAPKTEHTTFVILGNLMGEKGCDASWEHDIEPPLRCVDFSDDEEERSARKVRRGKKTAPADGSGADEGQKRQRNISVSSEQSSMNGDQRIPNQSPQRFQRGGGGGRGGAAGGRGNHRGRGDQSYSRNQHHQHPNPGQPQNYPQRYGQQPQAEWSNNQPDNYSWHNNLSFGGQRPSHFAPPQPHQGGGGYQQPPPQHIPHRSNPYANANQGGYPFHGNGPAPFAYQSNHHHHQHPPQQPQQQPPQAMYGSPQMYPSGPPPPVHRQQQHQQQQPPPPGAYYQPPPNHQ